MKQWRVKEYIKIYYLKYINFDSSALYCSITTSTSERAFSVLKRLLTYLRSTMTEITAFLMHVHKDITDTLDSNEIAKDFVTACNDRRKYFGSF